MLPPRTLRRFASALLLAGAFSAHAETPTLALPDAAADESWRRTLDEVGLTPGEGSDADVRVVRDAHGGWRITVWAEGRAVRTVDVPNPESENDRRFIAWLAASLVADVWPDWRADTPRPAPVTASERPPAVAAPRSAAPPESDRTVVPKPGPTAVEAPPHTLTPAPPPPELAPDRVDPPQASFAPPAAPAPAAAPVAPGVQARGGRPITALGAVVADLGVQLRERADAAARLDVGGGLVLARHVAVVAGLSVGGPDRPSTIERATASTWLGLWGRVGWAPPWTWAPRIDVDAGATMRTWSEAEGPLQTAWVPHLGGRLALARTLSGGAELGLLIAVRQDLRPVTLRDEADQVTPEAGTAVGIGLTVGWREQRNRTPE